MELTREKREPSTAMSLTVFGVAVAILLLGIVILKFDIHITLLIALIWACLASGSIGYSFDDLVGCMKKSLGQSMGAMIIFVFIGIIIASWIFSGTVPALIYYGLKFITPRLFLPVGLILCSVVSLATGTSWGTMGTMGIAMMGIGAGMGMPPALTAGMVLSGAYFGDKMSPMSDTTNLAPASAGTTLQKHISAMWKTTFPSSLIVLAVFVIIGFKYKSGNIDHETIDLFSETLAARFNMNLIVLLPMIVLFTLNIFKFPAIPGMAIGSMLGVLVAVFVQKTPAAEVLVGLNYGYVNETGVALIDKLLLRGGIQSMMYTFSLACIAISFGGVMEHVGYMHKVIELVVKRVKRDWLMAPLVISSTFLATAAMSEVYLSLVLTGNLYRQAFEERGLKNEFLSRLLEEGGTLMQVFVPWSTGSIFITATLGVTTAEYAKYALLNWINPLLSIILAACGLCIMRVSDSNNKENSRGELNAQKF